MKPFKIRHKNGKGRPSKVMKLMEAFINEHENIKLIEESTKMLLFDQITYGTILPETQKRVDELLKSRAK